MTVLSAGRAISEILAADAAVTSMVTDIFPVVSSTEATLPYIAYVRTGLATTLTKSPAVTDSAEIEVDCYAATYIESVELAEAVREALEGYRGNVGGLDVRVVTMSDAKEDWQGDAYIQSLTFRVRC